MMVLHKKKLVLTAAVAPVPDLTKYCTIVDIKNATTAII